MSETKNLKLLKEYSKKITDDHILKIHEGKISSSPLPVFCRRVKNELFQGL